MKRIHLLAVILLALALAGCDPFAADQIHEQAIADQMAMAAQQDALNQEAARQRAAEAHAWKMAEEARHQARGQALEPWIQFAMKAMIIVLLAALAYNVLRVGSQTAIQINRLQRGLTTAMIEAAQLRSRLIYLDPNTRQYPLVSSYIGKGRYTLTDPNKKVTMILDTRNEGDAQMIAGSIAVQHSGMLTMEQRRSGAKDAASMAIVKPPVIEGTAIDVKTIAQDIIKGKADE